MAATITSAIIATILNTGAFVADIPAKELICMVEAIHFEAGDQGRKGKQAVANVIDNRVDDRRFPKTVCNVVRQRGAFSYHQTKRPSQINIKHEATNASLRESVKIAKLALENRLPDITGGATHYLNPKIATGGQWRHAYIKTRSIHAHDFYKPRSKTAL